MLNSNKNNIDIRKGNKKKFTLDLFEGYKENEVLVNVNMLSSSFNTKNI